jgi:hypothetical protein
MNKVVASKFNKPMVLIMVLALLVLLLMVVALVFNKAGHESELPVQTEHDLHDHASHSVESSTVESNQVDDHAHMAGDANNADDSSNNDAMPRHQDMLTEEMKQAIRDKLFFHGPKEVIKHPDGRIELPSNGRFTQMPVAVKMPDGTIQIKEYSSLPE